MGNRFNTGNSPSDAYGCLGIFVWCMLAFFVSISAYFEASWINNYIILLLVILFFIIPISSTLIGNFIDKK